MASTEEILSEYDNCQRLYEDFTSQVEMLLRHLINDSSIPLHSITSRVKTRASLKGKLQRRQSPYDSLSMITDIAGVRITTYFADHVDAIAEIIRREFDIDADNSIDKRLTLDPDRFGYLSLHYITSLNDGRSRLTEYARFRGLRLEIQLRSLLQHAWAEMEHDLGYKSAQAIPREVRRQFARLAGLLEIADEEFIHIRESLAQYRNEVGERIASEPATVSLNRDSLLHYYNTGDTPRSIDQEIASVLGYSHFRPAESKASGEVERLDFVGLATIDELENSLRENRESIIALARHYSGGSDSDEEREDENDWLPRGISVFYLCKVLLASSGDVSRIQEFLNTFKIGSKDDRDTLARDYVNWYTSLSEGG